MNNPPQCLDLMLAAWNEHDPSLVRGRLEQALAPDVVFVDPTIETWGIDEFEKNVRDFRARYPQALVRRTSGFDSHHRQHRYSWEIAVRSRVILVGFDVTETNAAGKVQKVVGFFGPLPALAAA
jgi:hypothetical protein